MFKGIKRFFADLTGSNRHQLREIKRALDQLARGDFSVRLNIAEAGHYKTLANAINQTAEQIEHDFLALRAQKNELDRVLANLQQGIITVTPDQTVAWLNKSAALLLGTTIERAAGRSIQEVLRNIELQSFTEKALQERASIEAEITLYGDVERDIQVYSSVLLKSETETGGVLIVLNDVSRLRQLENMRKDFVANVSHELKTPITSIKGFVETLLDGALNDEAEAKRFLSIVARQADRLNAIFDDLLSLAKMEQSSGLDQIDVESSLVRAVIASAVQGCEVKARAKQISIQVDCESDLRADFNSSLVEQALTNLVDNAIKYSAPNSFVYIQAEVSPEGLNICVVDSGPGIERSHQSRVFERFYRVDPARSRQQGGTGLGLSIVKHVALVHGGYASVDSTPGKGSKFSLFIPSRVQFSSGKSSEGGQSAA